MNNEIQKRPRGRPKSIFNDAPAPIVQALDRGLGLLRDLAKSEGSTLSELALRLDMPASTTHRILATLEKHGFVEFNEATQQLSTGIEAFRVGNSYLARTNLLEAARTVMRRLMEETGETANLAIAHDGDVVFVGQVETQNPIRAFFSPGTRSHMHASGIGKALLAAMDRSAVEKILRKKGLPSFTDKTLTAVSDLFTDLALIATRGWSLDDEERYSGMRCVAATIYNEYAEPIAGISISGPTIRIDDAALAKLGVLISTAAREVTDMTGGKLPA